MEVSALSVLPRNGVDNACEMQCYVSDPFGTQVAGKDHLVTSVVTLVPRSHDVKGGGGGGIIVRG